MAIGLTSTDLLSCALLAFALAILVSLPVSKPVRGLRYPPGPKPLPFIGNLLDLASSKETSSYQHLAKQYGDLVFMNAFGKRILAVNSFKVAYELFEKQSMNYSDRPQSIMSHELLGWDFSFSHMMYGERWKKHRRMFHRQFQQSVAPTYQPIQRREAHTLLRNLLHRPEGLDFYLRHNAAAIVMSITYGINIAPTDDLYVTIAEKALEGVGMAASPGAFLVDFIPFLKYIPEWFPGASFKRRAREWKQATIAMRDLPFTTVLQNMKSGNAAPSFVSNLLSEIEGDKNDEEIEVIKNCAAVVYAAAAESTVSTLSSFILAMLTHPEAQDKAQEEIDRVIGHERLPDFEDRSSLPYINAILSEVLRWNPVAPLGLPHMVTNDSVFNGYHIPAQTIVVGNTWRILNDPEAYPDPRRFNPDRFLKLEEQGLCSENMPHLSPMNPLSAAFGYGRRICPGRFMGDAQVWISIACILSVFRISPSLDENGHPIAVTPEFSDSGFICHPLPFKFSLKPRGDTARMLIEQTEQTA